MNQFLQILNHLSSAKCSFRKRFERTLILLPPSSIEVMVSLHQSNSPAWTLAILFWTRYMTFTFVRLGRLGGCRILLKLRSRDLNVSWILGWDCEWLTLDCPTPSIPHPPQRVPIDYHINPIPPSSPIPQRSHQVTDYSIHSASNIIVEVAWTYLIQVEEGKYS